jgi:hypothetical protein
MKKTRMPLTSLGRIAVVSFLSTGLLFAGSDFSWADRGSDRGRHENRYQERYDSRHKKSDHSRQKVTVVRELPRGHRSVVVNKTRYYVHDHRFYTRGHGGYVLVRPPVGAVVATLPIGTVRVSIGSTFYFLSSDIYYRPTPRGYAVVAAPLPAVPVHTEAVMVWTATLNVRTGPGQHFPVIGQAWQGETLIISGYAPGWYHVLLPNGASGWVMSSYTRSLAAG